MSAILIDYRQAVVDELQAWLGDGVTVETHGGRFDLEELKRWSKRAPAVVVSVLGVPEKTENPRPGRAMVQTAVFVIVRDSHMAPRDEQGLTLTEAVIRRVANNRFNLEGVTGIPERLGGENLYSGGFDRHGIALWAVSWRQAVQLPPINDANDLADFTTYAATHEVGDEDTPNTESNATIPTDNPTD